MIENKDYEPEIDLKKLLSYILRRWKFVMAAAVVLGVILGGYKCVSGLRDLSDTEFLSREQQLYETGIVNYEQEIKSGERQIENLITSIERQENYLKDSILMNTSPYNVQVASANIYVETGYQIIPGNTYQDPDPASTILAAYETAATEGDLFRKIGQLPLLETIDSAYLKELISAEVSDSASVLFLRVKGSDMDLNEKILQEILNYIESQTPDICRSVAEHTIEIINQSTYTEVDMGLYDRQTKQNDTLARLNDSLKKEQEALMELEKPTLQLPSKRNAAKSSVKFALIGGVGGAAMVMLWFCMVYLMKNTIQDADELKKRYSLNVLGTLRTTHRGKSWITRLCDSLDGIPQTEIPENQQLEVIAEKMKNYSRDMNRILVLGIDQSEHSQKIFKTLCVAGKVVEAGENVIYDAAAVSKLSESDSVVFVITPNKTTYDEFKQNAETVETYGKQIIGVVFA